MRAFGYIRASTVDQKLTLQAQEQRLRSYCDYKGFELARLFTDSGVSAKIPLADRPQGKALNRVLEAGDHVVVARLDRAWRSPLDCLLTVKDWQERGIVLHLLNMNIDSSSIGGEFMITILSGMAQMERRTISERTREGLAQSDKTPGPIPWPDERNEEEVRAFALLKRLASEGMTDKLIAETLNQYRYLTRYGKPFTPRSVMKIRHRHGVPPGGRRSASKRSSGG